MYFIYSLLYLIALIILLPYFIFQEIKSPKYVKSLSQRLGFIPPNLNPERKPSIWIHSVSVGETIAAKPVITQLRKKHPDLKIFLTTTTITGHSIAVSSRYPIDALLYFPFDFALICRRFLRILNPDLLVLMEGEIWPNILNECKKRTIKVILINGRVSPRSFKRYRVIRPLFKKVLNTIDVFCMQSEEDAKRIVDIGAEQSKVVISGNLKFDQVDFSYSREKIEELKKLFPSAEKDKIIIAGSTHQGEEEIILKAFNYLRQHYPDLKLILVPRHPERCPQIEAMAKKFQLSYIKRSELSSPGAEKKYSLYLIDSIGELSILYALGYIIFVGGSLVPVGGHNILEPAFYGKPVIFGRHMDNFQFIASQFLKYRAGFQVSNLKELITSITMLLQDQTIYNEMSRNAQKLIDKNRGAIHTTIEAISRLIGGI
jgi:3-deoxy-D-manno-octulosonic-acid transferase